jgi:5-methylcytosine-specific restriction endonuclease McrA
LSFQLDPESKRFQEEIDAVVRRWAGGDDYEYWQRWRQLGNWSLNKTQGDVVKKERLKKELMLETGGRCQDCGRDFDKSALQMHRLDSRYAHDRGRNFGYFRENVALLCASCHYKRG